MPDPATLLWGLLFGAIGIGYFVYGKRQTLLVSMACGIALCVYPWFVSGAWLTFGAGVLLAAIPWFLRY